MKYKVKFLPLSAKCFYWGGLSLVSLLILLIFVKPGPMHSGINYYHPSKFSSMVNGTAHKPFIYRTLVPSTIRTIEALTPDTIEKKCIELISDNLFLEDIYKTFRWEPYYAYRYIWAVVIMFFSFLGFAHFTVKFIRDFYDLPDSWQSSLLLATILLLGLPPFFKYTSMIYDPTQLFLFTLALYMLERNRLKAFFFTFILCCLNKETAVLLVPLYGIIYFKRPNALTFAGFLSLLVISFLLIKGLLALHYHNNPGAFLELHLIDHNVTILSHGWNFQAYLTFMLGGILIFFRWQKKPCFLRVSLYTTLAPLLMMALFFGFFDEWRGYLEAYPVVFALIMDSFLRLKKNCK
ncbi:hypothetical protein GF407_08480 [candidate division KSB1 bacterium]|nr:hypothetical protein [candidate division KSB1 bacterium]